jgi:serine/threonine-protein kinase
VGGYVLEAVIGRGGMGVVYLATAPDGDQVAVKLLARDADDVLERRFLREARLAQTIDHPNVIPIYAAGSEDGELFIAMRYVAAGDLRRVLVREGALQPSRVVELVGALASALDVAHDHGLLHRDVKPGNVLVDASDGARDHPYITDFGLAKHSGDTTSALTGSGVLLGTIDYMAPEHVRGQTLDRRADVYSLGCVAYQCLTGATPFAGSDVAVLFRKLNELPPAPSSHDAALVRFDRVIAKVLAPRPADRYATAGKFAEAFELALTVDPPARRSRRRRSVVASAVAAAVTAVIGVTLALSEPGVHTRTTIRYPQFAPRLVLPLIWPATRTLPRFADLAIANDGGRRELSLSKLRGHAVLVDFFASWCPYSEADARLLAWAASNYPDIAVVGVAVQDKPGDARSLLRKAGAKYAAVEGVTATTRQWDVQGVPVALFVDGHGDIRYRTNGQLSVATLSRGLRAVDGHFSDVRAEGHYW